MRLNSTGIAALISDTPEGLKRIGGLFAKRGILCCYPSVLTAPSAVVKYCCGLFVVYAESTDFAPDICTRVRNSQPYVRILTVVGSRNADDGFRVFSDSDRELIMPCDDADILRELDFICPSRLQIGSFFVGETKDDTFLQGVRLGVSAAEFRILRLLAFGFPTATELSQIAALCLGTPSEQSVRNMVTSINKKSKAITGRRLVVFRSGYTLNPNV